MNLDPDSVSGNTYVAAFAGAILGLKAIPGDRPLARVSNLFFGFLIAVYVGPAAVDYLSITSPKVSSGVIFAVGAAGLVSFAALVDGIKQTRLGEIFASWLTRGGNKGA